MSGVPVGPLRRSRWLASLVAWCGERASVHTSRRLAAMLLLLVLVVVPTILLAGAAVWQAVRSEQKVADARLHDTAQALALAVDREIVGRMAALKAFATSPVFGSDPAAADMRAVDAQARQVARQIDAWVFLATRDGTRLVMTALPPGAPLPPIRGRDLLERIFATKTPGVGNLLVSAISHEHTFATAVPVMGA